MTESEWKSELPPPEAYSRVTNPERFRPLHAHALALVDRLAAEYDVARTEEFTLLPNMRPFEYARPPVTLIPRVAEAAPVAVAFTAFPSLVVRFGLWQSEAFPWCGCDACAETAASAGERLEELVGDVVTGKFREELVIPWFGRATARFELGRIEDGTGHCRGGGNSFARARARELLGDRPRRVQWQPWPRRG